MGIRDRDRGMAATLLCANVENIENSKQQYKDNNTPSLHDWTPLIHLTSVILFVNLEFDCSLVFDC
jgi:hypothetical protein